MAQGPAAGGPEGRPPWDVGGPNGPEWRRCGACEGARRVTVAAWLTRLPHHRRLHGIGAATARLAAEAGYRLVLAARSEDKLRALAASSAARARARGPLRRHRVGRPAGARRSARSTRSAASTSRSPTPASAARAGSSRATRRSGADGADQRLRRGADDPRDDAARCKRPRGHLLLTELGRRPARAAGLALLGDEVRRHRDGRGGAAGLQRHRRPRDADRARHGRHAVLRRAPAIEALRAEDIARAVMFAVSQPPHVDVNEILIRPTAQPN